MTMALWNVDARTRAPRLDVKRARPARPRPELRLATPSRPIRRQNPTRRVAPLARGCLQDVRKRRLRADSTKTRGESTAAASAPEHILAFRHWQAQQFAVRTHDEGRSVEETQESEPLRIIIYGVTRSGASLVPFYAVA